MRISHERARLAYGVIKRPVQTTCSRCMNLISRVLVSSRWQRVKAMKSMLSLLSFVGKSQMSRLIRSHWHIVKYIDLNALSELCRSQRYTSGIILVVWYTARMIRIILDQMECLLYQQSYKTLSGRCSNSLSRRFCVIRVRRFHSFTE